MSSAEEAGRKAKVNETGRKYRKPSDEDLRKIKRNIDMEEEERRRVTGDDLKTRPEGSGAQFESQANGEQQEQRQGGCR
ncbi:MAG TPA: hypothetical protein VFF30_05350 [Nitrososphaerales archaeon]|nr:hypothetical protein [Nitrososphaerales archaeon]